MTQAERTYRAIYKEITKLTTKLKELDEACVNDFRTHEPKRNELYFIREGLHRANTIILNIAIERKWTNLGSNKK